ncbi:choice-of-anchor I family protein [Motilimonas sp. 1_MG-2023]|uniref:choice-of-anchor I family protein n=1 Tax=Motilimonas sp. 1_MG-2023 TaxID=3062672 RepID=UPI0026E4038D|nr:choice-of-anchor I family protein [Motilimonas sp. 1_MG-2023]MDO6526164.1 choice-of-anchor I family protein [Motilimonas sp. 1_MG-2023]
MNFKGTTTLLASSLVLAFQATAAAPTEVSLDSAPKPALIARHASGVFDASAAEIVSFDKLSQQIFVVNAQSGAIDVFDASKLSSQAKVADELTLNNLPKVATLDVKHDVANKLAGAANSVAVSGDLLAVAIEAGDGKGNKRQGRGYAAFYKIGSDKKITFIKAVRVGFLPDMITFTPDGKAALVANEGEPSGDYNVDPEGSISLIKVNNGQPSEALELAFTDFNQGGKRAAEVPADLNVYGKSMKGVASSLAQDLEPEYISVTKDSSTAFVSLQENNGLAVVDVANGKIKQLISLGYKDYSQAENALDLNDRDNIESIKGTVLANGKAKINIQPWPHVVGMYQPDSVASYTVNGQHFVVTANEGDAREYFFDATKEECEAQGGLDWDEDDGCLSFNEEVRVEDLVGKAQFSPELAKMTGEEQLGRLKITNTLGKNSQGQYDTFYSYGARSFSIWTADGKQVFDSGSDFERITAERVGENFNASNDRAQNHKKNDRSSAKGPEPEALTLGEIDGRTYAFIGLERVGGFMIYDITTPAEAKFVSYTLNRDFTKNPTKEAAGDVGPEGMAFVSKGDSPTGKPLLIIGNEVSGSTSVYELR